MPATLTVRLTPRSTRDVVERIDDDGTLHVRVTAPPVDGRANAALVSVVARALDVAPSRVTIVAGATARLKRLSVEGLDGAALAARLRAATRDGHRARG